MRGPTARGQSFTQASVAVPDLAEEGDQFGGAMFVPDHSFDVIGAANLAESDILVATYSKQPMVIAQQFCYISAYTKGLPRGVATQGGIKVPGPDEPVGGAAPDAGADDEEVTLFDGEDVEAHVPEDGTAPTSEIFPEEEKNFIQALVDEAVSSNRDRGPDEQISVSPEEVN